MTTKRMTKATATKELVNNVCGKAINEANVPTGPLDKIEKKIEANDPSGDSEFIAYLAGLHTGSVAVARRWIERNPASALVYWAGTEATAKLPKSKSAVGR